MGAHAVGPQALPWIDSDHNRDLAKVGLRLAGQATEQIRLGAKRPQP
jgi:hypothetical protein